MVFGGVFMTRKKFTTTLDEELIKEIKKKAIEEDTDVSKILEKMIENYLKSAK